MYEKAAEMIRAAGYVVAFSGAGISVESGILPFRGEKGLWAKYDPSNFEINYFKKHPEESWRIIRQIFYEKFANARPNAAHYLLAAMEAGGMLNAVITQNIDNLHYKAGSKNVFEFHGNSRQLICLECGKSHKVSRVDLNIIPPKCDICSGLLKPEFVFFGEPIPEKAYAGSIREAQKSDALIVIGTTGEVMPASSIPHLAKLSGALIIEINVEESIYTVQITDIFIKAKAVEAATKLARYLNL